jgi:kynureninase
MGQTTITRAACEALDAADPLARFRERFELPAGVVYLDGNSLGALPKGVAERVADLVRRQWGERLIRSWNEAGWWNLPRTVGAKIAPIVGAAADEVVAGDGTSANIFKALAAALALNPSRRAILAEAGSFPTDLYVAAGLAEFMGGRELRLIGPGEGELADALAAGDVAAVILSQVDYRTGVLRDMGAETALIHKAGALVIWDLCHSAGALPIDLAGSQADFAVGCTYKYLNAGPGAPSFSFAAKRHHDTMTQPIRGWHGHARPFDFSAAYEPAAGVSRMLSGSQPVLALAALDAALELWPEVNLQALRAKSLALTEIFMALAADAGFTVITPRDAKRRGSQVSLRHPDGYPMVQALIERGVIGDFRAPDILRFGFAPLYLRHTDAYDAAAALADIVKTGVWKEQRYSLRQSVT